MGDFFVSYQKKRKEFGPPAVFEDSEMKILGVLESDAAKLAPYTFRSPTALLLDNTPMLSEHQVNTERVLTDSRGMKHMEGGWPKEIDFTETHDTNKWRTKMTKDQPVAYAVKSLTEQTNVALRQNNQIDMFEEYFVGETVDHSTQTLSCKTLMLFKDPCDVKRSVMKIAWHPEGGQRLAVAYSVQRFQSIQDNMQFQSYLWDINNPNKPDRQILGQSPLCCMAFNPKYSDNLVGGCYNGVVAMWDLRDSSSAPKHQTLIEKSHHEPVYDIYWLHGKSGTECVSVSTDGRMLWWDFKKPGEPTDSLLLTDGIPDGNRQEKVLGGTCLEYNPEAGATRYLAGTEQGIVVLANKKPGKPVEIQNRYGLEAGKHHSPIYAIQRNPEVTKFFLTVGDWCAKIWMEDLKTPIMITKYHGSYLTDGCWSPSRPGVFFLTESDGWLNVWDYNYRQNEVAFSHKVSDSMLTSLSVHNIPNNPRFGRLVAVGDADGTVTLMELCEALSVSAPPSNSEKLSITAMFEREQNREKNLQAAKRLGDVKKGVKKEEEKSARSVEKQQERLRTIEEDFFRSVAASEDAEAAMTSPAKESPAKRPAVEEAKAEEPPMRETYAEAAPEKQQEDVSGEAEYQEEPGAPLEEGKEEGREAEQLHEDPPMQAEPPMQLEEPPAQSEPMEPAEPTLQEPTEPTVQEPGPADPPLQGEEPPAHEEPPAEEQKEP